MILWAITLLLLIILASQDFRHRLIHISLFPALICVMLAQSVIHGTFSPTYLALNISLLFIQLSVVSVVLYLHTKSWLLRGERWIGWGDIAFFAVLAFGFPTINFILFYIGSMLILFLVIFLLSLFGRRIQNIPLAGGQAALLAVAFLWDIGQWGKTIFTDINLQQFIRIME